MASPKPIQTPQMSGTDFSASTLFEHDAATAATAAENAAARRTHSSRVIGERLLVYAGLGRGDYHKPGVPRRIVSDRRCNPGECRRHPVGHSGSAVKGDARLTE